MKRASARVEGGELLRPGSIPALDTSVLGGGEESPVTPHASLMIVPVVVMIAAMPLGLYVTGEGDITAGSGSTSVLWAVLAALVSTWILLLPRAWASTGSPGWRCAGPADSWDSPCSSCSRSRSATSRGSCGPESTSRR
jgi:hypothetical protein